jgi:hypothetical protein
MVISLYLFFCWLLFGFLITLAKKSSHRHLAFVFLFVDFVNNSIASLLADPFKFYQLSKDPLLYVSFSLYQSLVIPAMMVIIVHAYFHYPALHNKTAAFIISVVSFVSFDFLGRYLNLFTYDGMWHLAVLLGYRLILLYLTILALQCFRRMCTY